MAEYKDKNVENSESVEETQIDINGDDNIAGTSHLNEELSNNNDEISVEDKLQKEIAEWKDKFIRLTAEFENYKRRTSKERIELLQTAGKDVIVNMLEVIDDCDRAEKQISNSEDIQAIREGISLVFNKLRKKIESHGVKAIDAIGNDFDVNIHEAITEVPAAPEMNGKIIDEVEKGYHMNEKLIRFAKVIVGKS